MYVPIQPMDDLGERFNLNQSKCTKMTECHEFQYTLFGKFLFHSAYHNYANYSIYKELKVKIRITSS